MKLHVDIKVGFNTCGEEMQLIWITWKVLC